jgi:hypothetical protein
LHDVGKVAVDLHVEQVDGSVWHPWHGPLRQPYRFRYHKAREYRLHGAATGLLAASLLDPGLFDWLCAYPDLWPALLYLLAGQYEHAGKLGELILQADQASVAQALGGDPARAMAAPKHSLQRKLLEGLRYLLREELKLNQPQASDGWLTQDALWLVSKTVSDKLRAHLLAQGIEGIPANNTAVFNVLQDHGIVLPTPDGKAIWKATVASDAGWSHTFTLLRLSPSLIWESGERPEPFAGTVVVAPEEAEDIPAETAPAPVPAPDGVDSLLQLFEAPGMPPDKASSAKEFPLSDPPKPAPANTPDVPGQSADPPRTHGNASPEAPSGEHFITWLRQAIQMRKLIINDAQAKVHTVAGTVFLVSPGVFQRYAQEHPQVERLARQDEPGGWQWIQKRFEKLGLHRKQPDGLNIWTCEVTGPRKSRRLHGYHAATIVDCAHGRHHGQHGHGQRECLANDRHRQHHRRRRVRREHAEPPSRFPARQSAQAGHRHADAQLGQQRRLHGRDDRGRREDRALFHHQFRFTGT